MSAAQIQAADSAFYAAAVRRSVKLSPIKVTSGDVVTVTMPHAGIGTYALMTFVGTLSRTEGATVGTVNTSPNGPWNVFQNLSFTDYAGLTRLGNLSGALLNLRRRILTPRFDTQLSTPGSPNGELTSLTDYAYSIPAGTASSTTTSTLVTTVLVPFSMAHNSVKGSFPFTVPNGSSNLTFTIQPTISMVGSGTTPDPQNIALIPNVSGATTSVSVSGTINITYYYYDAPTGTPSPVGELSEVYELVNVRDSTNLTAGGTKQFVLQTGRTYYRIYQALVLAGALKTSNLTELSFKIDSSTPTTDEYIQSYVNRMAQFYGQPLPDGRIVWDFSSQPWSPDSYGALETDLNISSTASVAAPAYLDTTRECLYVSQSAPNLVQSGSTAG